MAAKIIFNDKLISEVRKRPCLWMISEDWRSHSEEPEMRLDVARKKAWWEIAQVLYTPEWEKQTPEAREAAVRTLQQRFRGMKNYYEGYKRGHKNWNTYPEYFSDLTFLDDHLLDLPPIPATPSDKTRQSKTEKFCSDDQQQWNSAMSSTMEFCRPNQFLADGVRCTQVMTKTEFDNIDNPVHSTVEQSTEEFYRPYPPSECQSVMARTQHDNQIKVRSVFSVENRILKPLTEVELCQPKSREEFYRPSPNLADGVSCRPVMVKTEFDNMDNPMNSTVERSVEEFYRPNPHLVDGASCKPVMIKTEKIDNIANSAHSRVDQSLEEFSRPDPPSECHSVMTITQHDDIKVTSIFSVENEILEPMTEAELCRPKSSTPDLVLSIVKSTKTQKDFKTSRTEFKSVANQENQTITETFNPNRSFLLSLLPDLEGLSPNMQLEFKMQIYNVIKLIKYPRPNS